MNPCRYTDTRAVLHGSGTTRHTADVRVPDGGGTCLTRSRSSSPTITLVRKGLRSTIVEDETLAVVGEAQSGDEALEMIVTLRPHVANLDIDMPGQSGLAVAREAAARDSATRVIFMTFHSDEDLLPAALAAGGMGYLKDSAMDDVRTAMHSVLAGRRFISSAMADRLVARARRPAVAQRLFLRRSRRPSARCCASFPRASRARHRRGAIDSLPDG